jgi:hypothetical protein
VTVERSIDKQPDAFRVWLTLIDLRTGKVVAKALDRATVESVNPEPLPFYRDSPTWHKDATIMGYINSCQVNTKIGDLADPEYLARLPAAPSSTRRSSPTTTARSRRPTGSTRKRSRSPTRATCAC